MNGAEFYDRAGLTAATDQVMAAATEILPVHLQETRDEIAEFGETEAFERRVLTAVTNASVTQVSIMYARALLLLVERGVQL